MILAIDIGNTDIVLGGIENNNIKFTARISTDRAKTEDQYAIEMRSLLNLYEADPKTMEGCIIASVVPPVLTTVRSAVSRLTGVKPMIVGPGMKTGLNIKIENPSGMGSEMICLSVAGLQEYKTPLVIFAMNAITTVSVLDKAGSYVGGCLCPGVGISLDAMYERTAQLPRISLDPPKKVIGTNTVDCMRSGLLFGNAAMIEGLVNRIEESLGSKVTVVSTGKLAPTVKDLCRCDVVYDEFLTLKGLSILYDKNKK